MTWQPYYLDRAAHDLVIENPDATNQVYKMRMTVAYGLERFWGEQLRLDGAKAAYWKATWDKLVKVMADAGMKIPNDDLGPKPSREAIKTMADKLWDFPEKHRKIALAVLTQLCDSMVWWTQRYKGNRE